MDLMPEDFDIGSISDLKNSPSVSSDEMNEKMEE
jgi:hypothetical protein